MAVALSVIAVTIGAVRGVNLPAGFNLRGAEGIKVGDEIPTLGLRQRLAPRRHQAVNVAVRDDREPAGRGGSARQVGRGEVGHWKFNLARHFAVARAARAVAAGAVLRVKKRAFGDGGSE